MRTLLATLSLLISLPLLAGEAELSAAVVALQSPESVLIDVRTADEFAAGALPGAEQIDNEQIASRIGRRSSIAEESLRAMGYSNLINAGGYDELKLALESQD